MSKTCRCETLLLDKFHQTQYDSLSENFEMEQTLQDMTLAGFDAIS